MRQKIFAMKSIRMEESKYRLMRLEAIKQDKSVYEILEPIIELGLPLYMKGKDKIKKNKKRQVFSKDEIEEMESKGGRK